MEVADYGEYGGIPTDDWKPGYQSDPESMKWSESAYLDDYTAAWVTHGDNFEKCEILEFKNEFERWRPL